jgi:hypothetical protein
VHPLLRAAAERQLGLFTAADTRRAGYDPSEVRRLCAAGTWVALRRGVYVTAEVLADADRRERRHRLECLAVLLGIDRPTAALSHGSAARLWGLTVRRDLARTVRLTDPHRWRRGPDYVMAQASLADGEVITRGPLRLTTVPRTLVDCAREWPLEDAVVAMDAALLTERTTAHRLAHAARLAHHRPGAAQAGRAVELADGRAESPLETRGRLRLIGSGFPPTDLQVEIRAGSRLIGVVDAWFDEAAVAVEFDGQVKYTDPWRQPGRVLWEEKRREDALRALGIRVARVADADLGAAWPDVEARLGRWFAEPGPRRRDFTATPRTRGVRRVG